MASARAIREQSAPCSRLIAMPTLHHSILQAGRSYWRQISSVRSLKARVAHKNVVLNSVVLCFDTAGWVTQITSSLQVYCSFSFYAWTPILQVNLSQFPTSVSSSSYTHTQRVGRYQKKHSPTHTRPDHRTSFINFFHLLRSIASSFFSLRARQSSLTTCVQVLVGLPLGLGPSTSYSMHFFTQSSSSFRSTCPYQRSLFCCNTNAMLCYSILPPVILKDEQCIQPPLLKHWNEQMSPKFSFGELGYLCLIQRRKAS